MQNGNTKTQGFDIHVILRETHSFLGLSVILQKNKPDGAEVARKQQQKSDTVNMRQKEKHGA